jgi:hypothetical protein
MPLSSRRPPVGEVAVEALHGARRVGVGPRLEGVLAGQLEQHGDLFEDVGHFALVHAVSSRPGGHRADNAYHRLPAAASRGGQRDSSRRPGPVGVAAGAFGPPAVVR